VVETGTLIARRNVGNSQHHQYPIFSDFDHAGSFTFRKAIRHSSPTILSGNLPADCTRSSRESFCSWRKRKLGRKSHAERHLEWDTFVSHFFEDTFSLKMNNKPHDLSQAVSYHTGQFPPGQLDYQALLEPLLNATDALARYDQILKGMHNSEIILAPFTSSPSVRISFPEESKNYSTSSPQVNLPS